MPATLTREKLLSFANEHREEYETLLRRFVETPTVSVDPNHLEDIKKGVELTVGTPATDGTYYWEDAYAIAVDAPHIDNAYAFINFILDPQVEAGIAKTVQYATPNAAAKKLMDKAYVDNPAIFPPAEVVAKCEPALYLGEEVTKLRSDIWTRVQAA